MIQVQPSPRAHLSRAHAGLSSLALLLFLLFPSRLFSSPCDDLPVQPDDEFPVEVTIGQMRKALCYADAYDAEVEARIKIEALYTRLLGEYETTIKAYRGLEVRLGKAQRTTSILMGVSITSGAVAVAAVLILVLLR